MSTIHSVPDLFTAIEERQYHHVEDVLLDHVSSDFHAAMLAAPLSTATRKVFEEWIEEIAEKGVVPLSDGWPPGSFKERLRLLCSDPEAFSSLCQRVSESDSNYWCKRFAAFIHGEPAESPTIAQQIHSSARRAAHRVYQHAALLLVTASVLFGGGAVFQASTYYQRLAKAEETLENLGAKEPIHLPPGMTSPLTSQGDALLLSCNANGMLFGSIRTTVTPPIAGVDWPAIELPRQTGVCVESRLPLPADVNDLHQVQIEFLLRDEAKQHAGLVAGPRKFSVNVVRTPWGVVANAVEPGFPRLSIDSNGQAGWFSIQAESRSSDPGMIAVLHQPADSANAFVSEAKAVGGFGSLARCELQLTDGEHYLTPVFARDPADLASVDVIHKLEFPAVDRRGKWFVQIKSGKVAAFERMQP